MSLLPEAGFKENDGRRETRVMGDAHMDGRDAKFLGAFPGSARETDEGLPGRKGKHGDIRRRDASGETRAEGLDRGFLGSPAAGQECRGALCACGAGWKL